MFATQNCADVVECLKDIVKNWQKVLIDEHFTLFFGDF